ncbi:unnamed protein product [Paramecium pentaurelia]|uniref:Uncharacterized protein n=1 Tax=Paramecium pentaurelia TaxID=43138 RepID=A0A8S1TX00_9CILI|nr:unnamed protein product [Paramecium pentaurelia]
MRNNHITDNNQSVQHLINDPNCTLRFILKQSIVNTLGSSIINIKLRSTSNQIQIQCQSQKSYTQTKQYLYQSGFHKNGIYRIQDFRYKIDVRNYQIEFVFECLEPMILKIYLLAVEIINNEFIIQNVNAFLIRNIPFQTCYNLEYKNQEKRQYPLIIEILLIYIKNIGKIGKIIILILFFKLNQNDIQLETLEIKIQKNDKAYTVRDIYGGQKDYNKNYVICLINKVNKLILPCKHMSLCQTCCQGLKERSQKCSIFRTRITSFRIIMRGQ